MRTWYYYLDCAKFRMKKKVFSSQIQSYESYQYVIEYVCCIHILYHHRIPKSMHGRSDIQ